MTRRSFSLVKASLVAVLMFVQYGLMPLLHAHAHQAGSSSHAGKAAPEDHCVFSKVAETPVTFLATTSILFGSSWLGPDAYLEPLHGEPLAVSVTATSRAPPTLA